MIDNGLCEICSQWLRLVHPTHWQKIFDYQLEEWFKMNLLRNLVKYQGENQKMIFSFACQTFWFRRNQAIFKTKQSSGDIVLDIRKRVHEFRSRMENKKNAGVHSMGDGQYNRQVAPQEDQIKINTDGAFQMVGQG